MRSERNNGFMPQMIPFNNQGNIPANMMMFPNYMNDNYTNLDNRVSSLEKKIKILDNRISRLENPYQNTNNQYQTTPTQQYQTTQNDSNYSGEMYMM